MLAVPLPCTMSRPTARILTATEASLLKSNSLEQPGWVFTREPHARVYFHKHLDVRGDKHLDVRGESGFPSVRRYSAVHSRHVVFL